MRTYFLPLIVGLLPGVCWGPSGVATALEPARLVFSCSADNDLYRVLADNGVTCPRYDTPAAAVQAAGRVIDQVDVPVQADGAAGPTTGHKPRIP